MATSTTAGKNLSTRELTLLKNFADTVTAQEYTNGIKIEKLVLSYDSTSGNFNIEYAEKAPEQVPVVE